MLPGEKESERNEFTEGRVATTSASVVAALLYQAICEYKKIILANGRRQPAGLALPAG
jgi:hypothetical protein